MTRDDLDAGIPTLAVALAEHMNADELKVLATLTKTRAPTRKAELVEHILQYLDGDRLRAVWQGLDDLQKAAVAEVVHSSDTTFPAARFRAKYGRLPDFGAVSRWPRAQPPTALRFFFYAIEPGGGTMPDDLKERLEAFVPPPVSATVTSLEELPAAYDRLSFAKTPSVGQVVDMSALIRRESQLDDHGPGREVHPLVPPELPSSPPPPIR